MFDERAARVYLKAHGFRAHVRIDECDACTRLAALEFIGSLPVDLREKASLTEWVVSEDFYGEY